MFCMRFGYLMDLKKNGLVSTWKSLDIRKMLTSGFLLSF